jgi:hypothetical protein
MSDDGRRAAGRLPQVPPAWRIALYAMWLLLLGVAFIVDLPALVVAAMIAATVQSAYILYVAISQREFVSSSPRVTRRAINILIWARIGLFLVWLALLVVGFFVIDVPALVIVAMVMVALQGVGIGRLTRARRHV